MTTQTMPLDNLIHCARCGERMNAASPDAAAYRCTGCGTRINARNANRTLIGHIMGNVMSVEFATEIKKTVQDMFEEQVRQEMPGVEPPDTSAEWIYHCALKPETYLKTDPEEATELMGIIVERIDADDRSAVITDRFTSLEEPQAAERRRQRVALLPAS